MIGVVKTCQSGALGLGIMGLLVPFSSTFRYVPKTSQGVLTVAVFFKSISNNQAFAGIIVLVNAAATAFDPGALGAINGAGQTLAATCRAIGPILASVLGAASLSWGWGHVSDVYYVFVIILVLCCVAAALLTGVTVTQSKKVQGKNESD